MIQERSGFRGMMLIDTTILVDALRDASGANAERLLTVLGAEEIFFTSFTELEVLMGARDEAEWDSIQRYFASKPVLEPNAASWSASARIYFDLRRMGRTVRSIVDCCIAQIAIEQDLTVLHNDRDFATIAEVRPLKHQRLQLEPFGHG
jgi:predicted nucleic acid-binding protein